MHDTNAAEPRRRNVRLAPMTHVLAWIFIGAMIWLSPSHASAKRKPRRAPVSGPSASRADSQESSSAPADSVEGGGADELVTKGEAQYRAGDHAGALRRFEAARAVQNTTTITLWIAKCLDQLGRDAEARTLYDRIADKSPDPFDADEAKQRLSLMGDRGMPGDAAAGGAPPAAPAATTESPPTDAVDEAPHPPRRGSKAKRGSGARGKRARPTAKKR